MLDSPDERYSKDIVALTHFFDVELPRKIVAFTSSYIRAASTSGCTGTCSMAMQTIPSISSPQPLKLRWREPPLSVLLGETSA